MENQHQKIKALIAEGDIGEAVRQLMEFSGETRYYNDAVLLSSRYRKVESDVMKGLSQGVTEWNHISNAVLLLSDEIAGQRGQSTQGPMAPDKNIVILGINMGGRFVREGGLLKEGLEGLVGLEISSEIILDINKAPGFIEEIPPESILHISDEDDKGLSYRSFFRKKPIGGDLIDTLAMMLDGKISLLVLSGCFDIEQARIFARYFPVLGLDARLEPVYSTRFLIGFYRQLHKGLPIESAFEEASELIKWESNGIEHFPILLIGG